jgi:nucleoside-diphosphate-sugar epimerase
MKLLIIGGTGLISTSVAQRAIDRGADVTLLNRGKTPVRLRGPFRVITGDRSDRSAFERLLRESGNWDCVIDMICSEPDDAASLARAFRGRIGQLIFCSTTNVYPKPADHYPVREEHRLGAAFKNGIDKAGCEVIHRQAEADGAYRVTIIRPGQTYGEGGPVLHSLGNGTAFLDRIRHGRPLVVQSDGNGLWSALHADDVANVFVAAAIKPEALGKTYNATGTEWMTWDRYHAGVAEALGATLPELVHIPAGLLAALAPDRAAQSLRSLQYPGIYDMAAAREQLGFCPLINFVEGMRRTIRWLEAEGRIEPWQSDPQYDRIIDGWKKWVKAGPLV